jgi:hypothetical protein
MVDMEMILDAVRQMSREEIDRLQQTIAETLKTLSSSPAVDRDRPPFAIGLHNGAVDFDIDDFNAELTDEFWFGKTDDPLSS